MARGTQWRALALAIGLAAAGAVIAYVLIGGSWAIAGIAIGAVTGSFASPFYDWIRGRDTRREDLRGALEKTPPGSWARLLDPRRELVGFVGRDDELAALIAWHADHEAGRLRLVTGPGGVGKTRLAVELAERVKKLGWRSERIADGQEASVIGVLRAATRSRALLVVDYAETRVGLKQMLAALASDQGEGVRVLLLARSAGDWWDQLGVGEPAVWDLIQSASKEELSLSPVVASGLSDAEVIALAIRSFARELGLPERTVEIYGDSGTGQRRVLDLHAAALVAVLGDGGTGTVRVDIGTVLGELLRHEQHFWYDSARAHGLPDGQDGTTARLLRQIVAAACLLGGATQDEARVLPSRVPGISLSAKIAEWLRALYPPDPGQADWIGSMQPDRLAELHTLRELAASQELAQACLTRLDARQALRAVTLLARASSDYPEAEELLSQALPDVADLIAGMDAPTETLTAIFNAIPYPTVVLAPAAVTLSRRITSHLPAGTEPAVRAYWLSNLGSRLSELGRPAEALTAQQEAFAINRELAAASPDRYRPDLAFSLANLGVTFYALGRHAEALTAKQEAVAMNRELAASSPDRNPDLASSLNNLGVTFSELGRPAEALAAEQEAVAIRRELAAASPDRHRPDLASSLTNLGITFSELGRHAEALTAKQEAVAMNRELAAVSPDRYRPDFARSLTALGHTFSELGRYVEALAAGQEAVAVNRELAAVSPDRYRPGLASALTAVGFWFSELGRPAEALAAEQEAVAIRRELAAASPDRYRLDLASALHNLCVTFSALGRHAEALTTVREAVAIRRELAAASPDRYRSDLALSLTALGVRLSTLGCPAEALPAEQEAVAIRRELAAASPDRYRPDLASSLHNLGITFTELGRLAEALTAEQEAVAIRRELAVASPDRYRLGLASSLNNLSEVLETLGRKAAADAARNEAAKLREQPAQPA
ncbi:MAG TPA: tetratricopeptide repeat protein [Streptosporangiaceae bacterium]|nr:tetratricopeptide repeat protein [Streptosporangiaceae bacterium]